MLGPSTGSIICSVGSSEVIDRQETIMGICCVGIEPGIAAPMAGRAGGSHAVNTEEHMVDISSIEPNISVILLIVDCVRSENGVTIMETHVDIASIGCKSSGACLTADCAVSNDVVDGVEPAIYDMFTAIISKTIIPNRSGETI